MFSLVACGQGGQNTQADEQFAEAYAQSNFRIEILKGRCDGVSLSLRLYRALRLFFSSCVLDFFFLIFFWQNAHWTCLLFYQSGIIIDKYDFIDK